MSQSPCGQTHPLCVYRITHTHAYTNITHTQHFFGFLVTTINIDIIVVVAPC